MKQSPEQTTRSRRQHRIELIIAVLGVLTAAISVVSYGYQGYTTGPSSLYWNALAQVISLGVWSYVVSRLLKRQGEERAFELGFIVLFLASPVNSLIVEGTGLLVGLGTAVAVVVAAGLVLPSRRSLIFIIGGLVSAAVSFLLDLFGPAGRAQPPVPIEAGNTIVVIATVIVLAMLFLQFRNYTLRTKLVIAFAAVALLTVGALTIAAQQSVREALTTNAANDLQARARSSALSIAITIDRNIDRLQVLSLNRLLEESLFETNEQYPADAAERIAVIRQRREQWDQKDPVLVASVQDHPVSEELKEFSELFVGNTEVLVTDRYGALVATTSKDQPYYLADNGWWQIAYNNGSGSVYVGQPTFNPMLNGYGIVMAVPVFAEESEGVVGILHTTLTLDPLYRALLLTGSSGDTNVDLFFPTGQVLTSDGRFLTLTVDQVAELRDAINSPFQVVNYRGEPAFSTQTVLGISDLQPQQYLRNLAWRTIATTRPQAIQSAVDSAATAALITGFVAIIASIGAALLLAQLLTRPIRRLTSVAEGIEAGDLFARAPVETADEIGTLAKAFNSMTARLQDTLAGLERRVAERTQELSEANRTLQANSSYLSALSDTSTGLFERLNLSELLQTIVERAGVLVGTQNGFVFFVEPNENEMEMRVGSGLYDDLVGTRAQSGVGLAGTVWQTGEPMIIEDYQKWEGRLPGSRRDALHAIVALPLKRGVRGGSRQETTGVIGLAYTEPGRTFGKTEIDILERFAELASLSLDNAELYANSENRVQELAALNTISTLVVQSGDFPTVVERVGEEIRRIFDADFGYFALVNVDQNLVEFPYAVDDGKRITIDPLPLGEGITSQVITSGQPMLLSNASADDYERLGAVDSGDGTSPQSLLVVPIRSGETVIGALSVQRMAQRRPFSMDDQKLLTTIAASVGVGVENASLVQATQRRVAELTALNRIGTILNTTDSLEERIKQTGRELIDIFSVSSVYIVLYDSIHDIVHMPFFMEEGVESDIPSGPRGTGFVSHILQTNQPLIINHNLLQRFEELGGIWIGDSTVSPKSYLGVPVAAGDQVLGVVALNALPEGRFTEGDVRFLSTIAGAVASAIQNDRLAEATERRLAELAALNTISSILTSDQTLISRISQVGRELHTIFRVSSVYVALYNAATNIVRMPFFMGNGQEFVVEPFEPGPGFTAHVIKTRTPLLINDDLEARMEALQARNIGDPAQSYLGAPIVLGDEILGVVGLSDVVKNKFQESDVRLLNTIAAAIGSAIQNARLIEQTQERARELDAVNSLAREITQQRSLDDLFQEVYLQVKSVTSADGLLISLYDDRTDTLTVPFLIDEGQRYEITPDALAFEREYAEQVRMGEPVMINSTPAEVAELEKLSAVAGGGRASRSRLYIPLMAGVRFLGMISLHSYEYNAYSERDVAVLSGLASHIAIALENARLFEQTREALSETQRLAARERQAAQEVMALNRRLSREGWQEYLVHERTELVAEATADTDSPISSGNGASNGKNDSHPVDTAKMVEVPIVLRGEVIGTIELEYDDLEKGWSQDQQELVNNVLENLGLALDNARLHQQTQRALAETRRLAEREKTSAEIADRIYAATDVKAILRIATQELRRTTGSARAVVRLTRDKGNS